MATATKEKSVERVEIEVSRLIRKLKRWTKEIEGHHQEIAKRNFAIGLEIAGFTELYPPRRYPHLEIMARISDAVGFSQNYLNLLSRIAGWLYHEKNIKAVLPYMQNKKIANWSSLTEHFFVSKGKTKSSIILSKRWSGTKSSLHNLKMALPRIEHRKINQIVEKLDDIVSRRL